MDKIKQNYDRVLLIVFAIITLIACSMLIMKSFAVGQNFPDVPEGKGKSFDEPASDKVAAAIGHVDKTMDWKPVKDNGSEKLFRLMASIPIVVRADDDTEIDLYDEGVPLREGLSNKYIIDHNLPYRRSDVASLDLDGDGFSNSEEFEQGGTDPRDPKDFPDPTNKLVSTGFKSEPYVVTFSSEAGGTDFSVKRVAPAAGQRLPRDQAWSVWVKMDEEFPKSGDDANRFKVTNFGKKDVTNPRTGAVTKDASVLTIRDKTSGEDIELVRRDKVDIPVHSVTFLYTGPGAPPGGDDFGGKEFKKGDEFKLAGQDITIKVEKVTETQAQLTATPAGKNPKTFSRPAK